MTNDPQTQIDQSVVEMLARRASRGTSDGLRGAILAAVQAGPQRRGPLARLRETIRGAGVGRVLVFAIVGAALIGGTLAFVAGSSPRPDAPDDDAIVVSPTGSPSASLDSTTGPLATSSPSASPVSSGIGRLAGLSRAVDFGKPFSFVIPDDVSDARLIQDFDRIYALAVGHDPTTQADTIDWGAEGIAVTILLDPMVHTCLADGTSTGRVAIRTDPVGLVKDLRQFSGITLTKVGTTKVDGHDAVVFDLEPGPCDFNDIHMRAGLSSGQFVPTTRPARLILTTVNKSPMGILIWADTRERLDTWIGQVQPLVDSIHFRD